MLKIDFETFYDPIPIQLLIRRKPFVLELVESEDANAHAVTNIIASQNFRLALDGFLYVGDLGRDDLSGGKIP